MNDQDKLGALLGAKAAKTGVKRKGTAKTKNGPGKLGADLGALAALTAAKTNGASVGSQAAAAGVAAMPANPYDLNAPTTPDQVQKLVDAEAKLKYGGVLSQLGTQQEQAPQFFQDYRNRLQGLQQGLVGAPGQGQLGGVYGNALNTLGQLGQTLAAGSAANIAAAGQQPVVPGSVSDPSVLGDAAKAAAVRAQMTGNFGGLLASQGTAENSYLSNRSASSGPLELQALQAVARTIADTQGQKGDYKVTALDKIKQDKASADQAAAQQKTALEIALGNISNDAATQKTNRIKIKLDAANKRADRAEHRAENTQDNKTSLTNAQIRAQAQRQAARARARQDARKTREDQQQKHQETRQANHKLIRNAAAKIFSYQSTSDVPVYGDKNDPKRQTGTRLPTEAEIKQRIRNELPDLTEPQLNKAVARARAKTKKKVGQTQAGQVVDFFPGA